MLVSSDNLVESLLGDFEFEVQVPYLLYRNAAQEVNGIWFYNARECEEVANLFNRYLLFVHSYKAEMCPFVFQLILYQEKLGRILNWAVTCMYHR